MLQDISPVHKHAAAAVSHLDEVCLFNASSEVYPDTLSSFVHPHMDWVTVRQVVIISSSSMPGQSVSVRGLHYWLMSTRTAQMLDRS